MCTDRGDSRDISCAASRLGMRQPPRGHDRGNVWKLMKAELLNCGHGKKRSYIYFHSSRVPRASSVLSCLQGEDRWCTHSVPHAQQPLVAGVPSEELRTIQFVYTPQIYTQSGPPGGGVPAKD